MRFPNSTRETNAGTNSAGAIAPSTCPSCKSAVIKTMSKAPNADSYWRCETCGDVWNDSRAQRVHARPHYR